MPRPVRLALAATLLLAVAPAATILIPTARADYMPPAPGAVPGWFPPGMAKPGKDAKGQPTGGWELNDWRVTQIAVAPDGRRITLTVYTNGLFEEKWPYTRILDRILARVCGIPEPSPVKAGMNDRGLGAQLLRALYKSKSRIKGEELGGNAGTTFEKRVVETKNGCRIEMTAEGARWHTVTTTVEGAT